MYFDKTISVQRLTPISGNNNKGEFTAVSGLENVDCNIQPAGHEMTVLVNGIYGKTYVAFLTTSGIKEGDRLTVQGTFIDNISQNKTLRVVGVGNWYFEPLPHFELVCTELQ